jgi:hypothetical protein
LVEKYLLLWYRRFIVEQKQDKQILKQLIVDERELKELREIKDTMYNEY